VTSGFGVMLSHFKYSNAQQVDIPLAPFFIGKLLGRKNYFDELHGLDPQLHKSLLQIKKYKGNVEDLCLDFTVSSGDMMGNQPIELFPGGASVNVTNSNRHQYIHLVADYRLNQQIAVQCRQFILGFSKVLLELLRFSCRSQLL
jgi:ubiquitin-protein ligase E3 C